jgi:transposase
MLSSAIAPPVSTSNGKDSRRFYNWRLKEVYESCELPTKAAYAASHTTLSNTYSKHTVQQSSWKHTTHTPPSKSLPKLSSVSLQSLIPGSTGAAAGASTASKSKKKQKTAAPAVPAVTDKEDEAQEAPTKRKTPFKRLAPLTGHLRTCKVLMLPTRLQVLELKRCFSAARRAYNQTVARIEGGAQISAYALQKSFRTEPPPHWATGTQAVASSIMAKAVNQAVGAYTSNFAKKKKDPKHHFDVGFRSTKRTPTEMIQIEKDRYGSDNKHSTLLAFRPVPHTRRPECLAFFGNNLKSVGGIRLQSSHTETITRMLAEGNRLKEDAKIHFDKRTNKFHFIYTFEAPKLEDPDPGFLNKRVVATDPGIKAFQTWYSPTTGQYGELLSGTDAEMKKRCLRLDVLQSRVARREGRRGKPHSGGRTAKQRGRTTRRLRTKLSKERRRLHNWMRAAHYDSANFMLERFDVIIQPELRVSELAKKTDRKLGSSTVRKMLTWSHYAFRQRLKSASIRYAGRHVIESQEPGTSKTCTNCGYWHADLTLSDRTFVCPRCHIEVDRDVAGARNNFFSEYGRAVGVGWDGASG